MLEVHHAVRYALRFTGSLLFTHRSSGFLLSQRECFCNSAPSWCSFLHGLHKAVCIIRLHKTGDYSIQCFSGKALSKLNIHQSTFNPLRWQLLSELRQLQPLSAKQCSSVLFSSHGSTPINASRPPLIWPSSSSETTWYGCSPFSVLFIPNNLRVTATKVLFFSITTIPKHIYISSTLGADDQRTGWCDHMCYYEEANSSSQRCRR